MSFPRKRESIISDTYKYLDSQIRGNDNYLRLHYDYTVINNLSEQFA
jgi:hypothetical protein